MDKLSIFTEDAHNFANSVNNFGLDSQARFGGLSSRLNGRVFNGSGWVGPAANAGSDGHNAWNTNGNTHIALWNSDQATALRGGVQSHEAMDMANQSRNANVAAFAGGSIGGAINPVA